MPPRAFQKLNRQPIPGQPADRGADDAFRRVQIGITEATKVEQAQISQVEGEIPPYSLTPPTIGSTASPGTSDTVVRGNAVLQGVHSVNGGSPVYGDLIFAGNVVSQAGQTF